ncbi:MAG: ester cyclase [Woeseiaceae bacterium]
MTSEINQQNKQLVWGFWQRLGSSANCHADGELAQYLDREHVWHGPDPINEVRGIDAFASDFWHPLLHSFPDLKRQCHVFIGGASSGRANGSNDGRMWVGGTGVFNATFANDYLSIPATSETISIRWGEFCCIEQGKIVETYCLLDFVDLMQQSGVDVLPPSRGVDGVYPPPRARDGILLEAQDEQTSAHTLDHIRRFIFDALNSYDQSALKSMGIADYFHPNVQWYGPGGIGACLSLKEFEDNHQRHWLHAYPDRQVQDLDALIAEGSYSGGPGWAGVLATHTGDYLDAKATNKPIEFNGLDFWKLENDRYVENWVFVDMVHLFRQFGVNLFDRMAR